MIDAAIRRARSRWLTSAMVNAGGRWAALPAGAAALLGITLALFGVHSLFWLLTVSLLGAVGVLVTLVLIRNHYARPGASGAPDWTLLLDRALQLDDALPTMLESNGEFRALMEARVAAGLDPVRAKQATPARRWGALIVALILALMPLVFLRPASSVASEPMLAETQPVESADDQAVAVPRLDFIDPSIGPTSGGNTVRIYGGNLLNVAQVYFGEEPAMFAMGVAPDLIVCLAPVHEAGVVEVSVETQSGVRGNGLQYTYIEGASGPGAGGDSGRGGGGKDGEVAKRPNEDKSEGTAGEKPENEQPREMKSNPEPKEGGAGDNDTPPISGPKPPDEEVETDLNHVKPVAGDGETSKQDRSHWVYNPDGEKLDGSNPVPRDLKHPGEKSMPRTKVTTGERKRIEEVFRKLYE